MSDSGRDNEKRAVHPAVTAWKQFNQFRAAIFDGPTDGRYLANRLNEAFNAGWSACERAVKNAMEGREP